MVRVGLAEAQETLVAVLRRLGFADEPAQLCARLFVEASCDGVYSHGLHRFPRFVRMVKNGSIRVDAEPELVERHGALERWDGHYGPGNLNAWKSMERAIAIAREHGIGCVALAHTNHWMRGGTYGWQAAGARAIAICWTNTLANLPPWGASAPRVGNNPLVIAAPRASGHVVLDMAMSQFSYGALESHRLRGAILPVHGGYDRHGELTRDAAEIEATQRLLPIGYWKGSGLALLLDLVAGMLSGGQFTREIPAEPERESGQSQVFVAFDARRFDTDAVADAVIAHFHGTDVGGETVRYPGEQVLAVRRRNRTEGVPVDASVWAEIRHI